MTDRMINEIKKNGLYDSPKYRYWLQPFGSCQRVMRAERFSDGGVSVDWEPAAILMHGNSSYGTGIDWWVECDPMGTCRRIHANGLRFMVEVNVTDQWYEPLPCSVGEFIWMIDHEHWTLC